MQTIKYLIIAISILITTGCMSEHSRNQTTAELTKERIDEYAYDFVYPIPTAFEVTEMLKGMDAGYILGSCNGPLNATKYITEKKSAVNLGIYTADICYASTYNRLDDVNAFVDAAYKMMDCLDVLHIMDKSLLDELNDNKDDPSERTRIISDMFYKLYDTLNKQGRPDVAMLIVYGAWTESIYLAVNISECTFENKMLMRIIADQKESVKTLSELVIQDDGLTELNVLYSNTDGAITEDVFHKIKNIVLDLRKNMTTFEL